MLSKKSKCFELYSSLKPEQQKRFARWLEIEVDKRQELIVPIFHLMKEGKSNDEIRMELLKNERNKEGLNKELNKLTHYLEDFIVSEMIRKQRPIERQTLLVEYLYKNGLGHLNKLETSSLLDLVEKQSFKDDHYYDCMCKAYEYLQMQLLIYTPRAGKNYSSPIFVNKEQHLALEYLRYSCIARNNRLTDAGIFQDEQVKQMIGVMEQSPILRENGVFNLYLKFYALFENDAIEITTLSDELEKNQERLPKNEIIDLFRMLLNYSRRIVNRTQSKENYQKDWNLYKLGIKNGWFKIHGEVSAVNYKNMVLTGLKLYKPEELVKHLDEDQLLTPAIEQYNEDIWILTEAYKSFELEQYLDVIQKVNSHSFQNDYYKLDAKLVKLKAEYVRNQKVLREEKLDVKYDHNPSIANICKASYLLIEKNKNMYPQLAKEFKLLYKLAFYSTKERLKEVLAELHDAQSVYPNKEWYVKAVEERLERLV